MTETGTVDVKAAPPGGVSLTVYFERRFELLTESMKEQGHVQKDALVAFTEATKVSLAALKAAAEAAQAATDLRYQQRFEAQSDALTAAFLSQQTAMQTAFTVAEKAVQAALAAADRAVSKAELAADKRFEALNELRSMLNDMVATLMTRVEALQRFEANASKQEAQNARIDQIEGRFNTLSGSIMGGAANRELTRSNLATLILIVSAVTGLVGWLIAHFMK
jgi:hypothetical protein